MKQWPYYTNVYYKYIHVSFNIDLMKFIIILKIILHHISFVKIIIVLLLRITFTTKQEATTLLHKWWLTTKFF
jgi:hypothetical protein